jgi:hypothetical protein
MRLFGGGLFAVGLLAAAACSTQSSSGGGVTGGGGDLSGTGIGGNAGADGTAGGGNVACDTPCSRAADCSAAEYCAKAPNDVGGSGCCAPLGEAGASCGDDADCASGLCSGCSPHSGGGFCNADQYADDGEICYGLYCEKSSPCAPDSFCNAYWSGDCGSTAGNNQQKAYCMKLYGAPTGTLCCSDEVCASKVCAVDPSDSLTHCK